MKENNEAVRVGVYLNQHLIDRCDATAQMQHISRSELIRDALEYYIAVLSAKESGKVLTPALESVISSRIALTEDRLSRIVFKLGVEVAMMNNIMAAKYNINSDTIYQKQTDVRDELRQEGRERIQQIVEEINHGQYQNPEMESLLLQLSKRLAQRKGKKQYGYLNAGSKKIVDSIVAELASDSRIQELYQLWYEQKEDVLRTYTNAFPERVPLEQNKEFKTIRNAVVQAASELTTEQTPSAYETPLSAPCAPVVQVSPPASDASTPAPQVAPVTPPVQKIQAGNAITRLIQHLARLLQDSAEQNFQKRQNIDRKLHRQIEEKKQAQGLKSDGYSGMQM